MAHNILLVDDQRDILRLVHATLDTLTNAKLEIFECQSGEEALLESTRHKIDLLVTDYKLPGMTGVELMHKVRARHPEAKVIIISGVTERKAREEMVSAGAFGIFTKPLSLPDFLDSVERGLGLVKTMFASEIKAEEKPAERPVKLSDLLTNFRQDIGADVVFLINQGGFVQARTGKLRDDSVEAALISIVVVLHNASLKVANFTRQTTLTSYHIFSGGEYDLLFIPVNPMYALFIAGAGLGAEARVLDTVASIVALRGELEKSLKSIGATGELRQQQDMVNARRAVTPATPGAPMSAAMSVPTVRRPERAFLEAAAAAKPAPEMEALLKGVTEKKAAPANVDDFWNQAAEKHGAKSVNPNVISMEEARKRGLIPDDEK